MPFGFRRSKAGLGGLEGDDLAEDIRLAHAPRDELRPLRAEIDDEDGRMILELPLRAVTP